MFNMIELLLLFLQDAVKRKAIGILGMQGLQQGQSWRCFHHEYHQCCDCEEYHSSFEGADRELDGLAA
ncbi:hypothetical protein LINPERHAP1_LOCUS14512 [Linum perenne]